MFLLNSNQEQASLFNYNQTDERHAVAVHTQNARNQFFPTPSPDSFYSGDTETLASIGLRKDYCAWTWGDALFVILDNYWHSAALVDSGFREQDSSGGKGGRGQRDWWDVCGLRTRGRLDVSASHGGWPAGTPRRFWSWSRRRWAAGHGFAGCQARRIPLR